MQARALLRLLQQLPSLIRAWLIGLLKAGHGMEIADSVDHGKVEPPRLATGRAPLRNGQMGTQAQADEPN